MTEVTENEVQTISLNDKEYKVEDLSDKAKYLVSQVQDMQTQANQTRAKLDQIEVGIRGLTNLLQEELENPAPLEGEGPAEGEVVN
jgi:chromosome segregation ATPase